MKILKPLTSMKGNTVYVNYIRDENSKYVTIEPACAGWEFPATKFGVARYDRPRYNGSSGPKWQLKITMKVDNTMGFVTDHICPLDFKPEL